MTRAILTLSTALLLCASGCDKDPFSLSPKELADRIRENTPTELPPITTVGANTMGAYIHTDTGRVLFVASGVDRPETALAESLDCEGFNNFLYLSNNYLSASGIFCERSEIGDHRQINLSFGYIQPDSLQILFAYQNYKTSESSNYWSRNFKNSDIIFQLLRDDRIQHIFSGTFSGRIINRDPPYDTLSISDGRFDVTFGITP